MYIMCSDHFGAVCAGPYRSAFRCRSIGLEICLPGGLSFGAFDGREYGCYFVAAKMKGAGVYCSLISFISFLKSIFVERSRFQGRSRVSENRADRGAVGITG